MKVFISADCGIMHLASASHIPVLGLFKFDNIEKYRPYGYNSTGIRTQDLNIDDIFREIDNIISITTI
jgi:ADP-heptose:LPS heptosyltransferase